MIPVTILLILFCPKPAPRIKFTLSFPGNWIIVRPSLILCWVQKNFDSLWVNFKKKYEFNPLHKHSGVFSFVIWMQIPYSFTEESSIHFVKSSNHPSAGRFCFVDSLGESTYIDTPAGTQGLMCIFPSFLKHIVYPFYTSSDYRISVSGNITFELVWSF